MAQALALARRGLGPTWPNPSVGCVMVSADGEIVGRGRTAPGGRPHAEAVALERAGERRRGATLYVTLEPCAHEGAAPLAPTRSPPPACARRRRHGRSRSAHRRRRLRPAPRRRHRGDRRRAARRGLRGQARPCAPRHRRAPGGDLEARARQRRPRAARTGRRADLGHGRLRPRPRPSACAPAPTPSWWAAAPSSPTIRASPAGCPAWSAARRCGWCWTGACARRSTRACSRTRWCRSGSSALPMRSDANAAALQERGAEIIPVAIDAHGLPAIKEALEQLAMRGITRASGRGRPVGRPCRFSMPISSTRR